MSNETDSGEVGKYIRLPEDQYAHRGVSTEWWWHVGSLVGADGRKFGFEINATGIKVQSIPDAVGYIDVAELTGMNVIALR